MLVFIFIPARQVLREEWIPTLPYTGPWVVVSRPEVVEPRLLVQLLRAEEIRRSLLVGVLLHPRFAKREVLDVLEQLTVQVGDVVGAPDVVRVIEEDVL